MLITHERDKLIQAISYFTTHTRKCGKTKLFKLLYFLDFEHFKATGRSVTGLIYNAWPKGPVPVSLFEELDNPQQDLAEAFRFEQKPVKDGFMLKIIPNHNFSDANFSRRELDLIKHLASEYRNSDADDMVEATHLENLPWDRIYNQQGSYQAVIPYELAVRPDERSAVMRIAEERKELVERLK
jgi:uncharacterized phage-associated protein